MKDEITNDKILVKENIKLLFDGFKNILKSISEELDQDFIQNKDEYSREARNHNWLQLKKDIKSTGNNVNRLYSKLIFMLEEANQWRKK